MSLPVLSRCASISASSDASPLSSSGCETNRTAREGCCPASSAIDSLMRSARSVEVVTTIRLATRVRVTGSSRSRGVSEPSFHSWVSSRSMAATWTPWAFHETVSERIPASAASTAIFGPPFSKSVAMCAPPIRSARLPGEVPTCLPRSWGTSPAAGCFSTDPEWAPTDSRTTQPRRDG